MQEQLLKLSTSAGHLALVNDREYLGRCNLMLPKHGRCSDLCVDFRAVMDDASAYLEARPPLPVASQPSMFDQEVAG